jgi:hypothetical protein
VGAQTEVQGKSRGRAPPSIPELVHSLSFLLGSKDAGQTWHVVKKLMV